jgi:hypothetical protein
VQAPEVNHESVQSAPILDLHVLLNEVNGQAGFDLTSEI